MKLTKPRLSTVLIVGAIVLIVYGVAIVAVSFINRWRDEVIASHSVMTELVARQLQQNTVEFFNDRSIQHILKQELIDTRSLAALDSTLKIHTELYLSEVIGLEGGFYLRQFDEFVGYAYPTLPPPKPVYGPPPRSYDIIRQQILKSINENRIIVNLHQFDPAVFPLSTIPLEMNGTLIGAAWTRIHIERKLPAYKLREIISVIATISAVGFVLAVMIFLSLQKRTRDIRLGLETIQKDPGYRFNIQGGTYGFIADSINSLVDNLDRENRNLQKMEKELHHQDKLASLGKLIAGVAHEVKTPLAIIKTRVQLWQSSLNGSSEQASDHSIVTDESMELVVAEINRLTTLVNRLLVFSKSIADNLSPTDINQLIEETVELIQPRKPAVSFSRDLDKSIPASLLDPQAMKQVLINVLNNSVQAVADSGCINISTRLINDSKKIQINITDNGPGIPASEIERIFDPFFTTKEGGAGLGLSISYEIVKAHSGVIRFKDGEDGGTICEIDLPISI